MTIAVDSLDQWVRIAARPAAHARALFLDRDGTLIENIPYLSDPDAVSVIPGATDTIDAFRAAGFAIVIVTNQSGVARGLISPEQYRAVDAAVLERSTPVTPAPFIPTATIAMLRTIRGGSRVAG